MENYIGTQFFKQDRQIALNLIYESEIKLLYIGAEWSKPCRAFNENLLKFYNKVNRSKNNVEIIFISCDRNEEEFNKITGDMPWCYIAFKEQGLRDIIVRHYEVIAIPCLLLLNSWGISVSNTLVHDVCRVPRKDCLALWRQKISENSKPTGL